MCWLCFNPISAVSLTLIFQHANIQSCQVGDFIARICWFWRIGAPSGYKKLFLAIRKFWLNSGYFMKMDFTCHESLTVGLFSNSLWVCGANYSIARLSIFKIPRKMAKLDVKFPTGNFFAYSKLFLYLKMSCFEAKLAIKFWLISGYFGRLSSG